MNTSREIRGWYESLGLTPGCSWQEIRDAYRRCVQRWHPDRFQEDSEKFEESKKQILQINHAYRSLSEYRNKYGNLPGYSKDTASTPYSRPTGQYDRTTASSASDYPETEWPFSERSRNKRRLRKSSLGFIAVLGVLLVYYKISVDVPSDTTPQFGPNKSEVRRTESKGGSGIILGATKRSSPELYFSIGSELKEVIDIQGTPTRVEGNVLYFGKSKVYIVNGTVKNWDAHPDSPIMAKLDIERSKDRTIRSIQKSRFKQGSTKADVMALQGEPILKTENLWDYGVSKIYFEGGKVSGWYSSPLNPLKLEKGLPGTNTINRKR